MFGLFGGSQNDIYGDTTGLSGGYGGVGRGLGGMSNTLMMAGLGLMSSPRNNPFENVMKAVVAGSELDDRQGNTAAKKRALYTAYRASGLDHQKAALLAESGDSSIGKLLLEQQEKVRLSKQLEEVEKRPRGDSDIYGTGGGSAPRSAPSGPRQLPMPSSPSMSDSPLAPSAHVAPTSGGTSLADAETPFHQLVTQAEGTAKGRGFDETLAYGKFTGGPVNLTGMKVADVLNLQQQMLRHPANNFNSSAAGAYQVVGKTLRGLVQQGVVSPDDVYDAKTQNKIATHLAQGRGPDVAGLRNEWEGLRRVPASKILEAYNASFGPGAVRPTQVASVDGFVPQAASPPSGAEGFTGPDFPVDAGASAVMQAPANTPDGFFVPPAPQVEAPQAPAPQAAAPSGVQVASANPNFVPGQGPQLNEEEFNAQLAGPRGQAAQAPTRTITDAPPPRMVQTTRERPMGTAPAQSQANPETGQTPAFIMRRRAILQEAKRLQDKTIILEKMGNKAAAESNREEIKYLYDLAKPSDLERNLLMRNVQPGSKQWDDEMRQGMPGQADTTDIKEHKYSVKTPGFFEYQKSLKTAGAPKTQINTAEGFDVEQKKAKMKLDVEMAQEIGKQALAGRRLLPLLNEVERLADKTPGGWAGPVAAEAAKAFSAVGIEVPQGWSNAELLQSISQRLVPIVREPGPTSEKELKIYVRAVPGLMQSPEGRKKVVTMTRSIVERANDIAKIYRQNLGADDLHDKLAALDKPLIPDSMRAEIERLGGESAEPAIPLGAAEKLKKNPSLRKDFDEKYGAGSADRVLGR